MCVPCGDERDFRFSKKYKINIINIFKNIDISIKPHTEKKYDALINSDFLNGLNYEEASQKIGFKFEKDNLGFKNTKTKDNPKLLHIRKNFFIVINVLIIKVCFKNLR